MKHIILIILFITTMAVDSNAQSNPDTLKIGAILSFSGFDGQAGQPNQNALQLCINAWNGKGGVNDRPLELKVYDTQSNPAISGALADSMIKHYQPEIVYMAMSDVVMNTQGAFEANKVIQLAAAGGNVFANSPKYVLRGYFSVYDLSTFFVENISRFTTSNSFSVFYDKNGFTDMYMDGLTKAANSNNVKINHVVDLKGDVSNYASIIAASGVPKDETIYIAAPHVSMPLEPLGELIKLLREHGYTGAIVSDAAIIENVPKSIYGNNKSNLYYLSIKESVSGNKVKETYRTQYGTDMDERSLVMYNSLNTILNYMDENQTPEPEKVMAGINGIVNNQVIEGTTVSGNEIRIGVQINKVE